MHRKVVSNARYSSSSTGASLTYTIELGSGFSQYKDVLVMVVVKQFSTNAEVFVQAMHSPDGFRFTKHSDVIGTAVSPEAPNADGLLAGQTDESIMIGESVNLAFTVFDALSTGEEWVLVDVYVTAKAF